MGAAKRPLKPNTDGLIPHPGQWASLTGAAASGAGLSASDAQRAARVERGREPAQLAYYPDDMNAPLSLHPIVAELAEVIRAEAAYAAKVWLVGGALRDALLQRTSTDIDLAVDGDARGLARALAKALRGNYYTLDETRDIGRVLIERAGQALVVDVARLRGAMLAEDLLARDFTFNSMALPLAPGAEGEIIDLAGGREDLRRKVVRASAPTAIAADPIRAVRAIRFAAAFGFRIEPDTLTQVRAAGARLAQVSAERVRDEFLKCLAGPRPGAALRALDQMGLLTEVLPELEPLRGLEQSGPHVEDAFRHTLTVVERLDAVLSVLAPRHDIEAASEFALGLIAGRVGRFRNEISARLSEELAPGRSRRSLLLLAALLHDSGKPETRSVGDDGRIHFYRHDSAGRAIAVRCAGRLKLSNDESAWVARVVAGHMRPLNFDPSKSLSRRALHRFHRAVTDAGVEICLLSLADQLAKWGQAPPQKQWADFVDRIVELLEAFFLQKETIVTPPPLLTGSDLIAELGLQPGPQIGELLRALAEAQATGEATTRDEALDFARKMLR